MSKSPVSIWNFAGNSLKYISNQLNHFFDRKTESKTKWKDGMKRENEKTEWKDRTKRQNKKIKLKS